MRLKETEIKKIKEIILKIFGESKIYIFGSRLDDVKKGGDIDIFVIPKNKDMLFSKKAKAEFLLENELFKPIDIIVHKNFNRLIEKEALKGIEI